MAMRRSSRVAFAVPVRSDEMSRLGQIGAGRQRAGHWRDAVIHRTAVPFNEFQRRAWLEALLYTQGRRMGEYVGQRVGAAEDEEHRGREPEPVRGHDALAFHRSRVRCAPARRGESHRLRGRRTTAGKQ